MNPARLAALLNEAAQAGTPVTIRYAVGSRPTTHRVLPVAATGTVLRARDLDADRMRVFLLADVELVDVPAPPKESTLTGPPRKERPLSDQQRLASLVETLRLFGWLLRLSSDSIAVYAPRRDGTPTSVAAASITRNAGTAAKNRRLRRPWTVVAPGLPRARSFAALDQAIPVFLRQIAMYAPALRRHPPTP